nr:hypothetical protein [Tanacetum cinerariifolium]
MFLGKYFPTSMVTKLRNKITNFCQRPDESLFEEWVRYKLSIDRCPNHNMLPVTQIDTFYNSLTLRHRDTSNAAAGGTFMKRCPKECYDLIKNMTAYHNDWDTSAQRTTVGNTQNVYAAGAYQVVERETEATKDMVHPNNNKSTKDVQPLVVPTESPILNSEPVISPIIEPVASPVSAPKPNLRPLIPYPSRLQDQKLYDKANDQREKFFQIFRDLNFNISFVDALILMPKTPLNEHCLAVLLKKFPKKLGDPGKFLIPCDFPGMDECLALADLGASINLMPLSVWNKFSLPNLSPTCMTLELADRLISRSVGVAEDVFVKVGTFHFPTDFVVVDFDADPRVPLILKRSFLKTRRALIDGFEEYSQEVLGFSDLIAGINPTPYYDPIVSTTSLTLTLFGNNDFLLEEVDAFLALEDDPTSPKVNHSYVDTEGGILLLEAFLNDDPSLPPLNQGNYLPEVRKELKICEAKSDKSSIDEPQRLNSKTYLPISNTHFWKKLSDIKGIDPEFCTHKILMEEDFEPTVQHQRRVNPKIHDVIKNEVLKLLDAGLIYPISDSPWVSPVHFVPKTGGFTVVQNEKNVLILTRLVTS